MIRHADPLNCEASISALVAGVVTANADFYVRNHFEIPTIDPSTWRLQLGGLVRRPLSLSLQDLQRMPSATEIVTLECAGNGRSMLHPAVEGEQWAWAPSAPPSGLAFRSSKSLIWPESNCERASCSFGAPMPG